MTTGTLAHHVERFLSTKYNPETQIWYAKYLKPMQEHLGVEKALGTVTRADAEAYWQKLRQRKGCWESHPSKPTQERTLAVSTLINHLRAARTFWNEMVRQRLVEYNPFDHIQTPKDNRPVAMKAIRPEDLRTIWQAALKSSTRDFALITLMATSAVRAGELVSMKLSQINLKSGEVWVDGKRGWRKVFLGKASLQAVCAYLQERLEMPTDHLWLNCHGEPLTTDGVRQMVDRLADKAEVKGRHNLHAFRHRVAQSWLDNGINAEIVAQALGHANVTVTLTIYSNQDDQRVRKAFQQAELYPFRDPRGFDDLDLPEIVKLLSDKLTHKLEGNEPASSLAI